MSIVCCSCTHPRCSQRPTGKQWEQFRSDFLESASQLTATIYQSHLVNLVNDVLLASHLDADFGRVVGEEEEEAPVGPIGKQ